MPTSSIVSQKTTRVIELAVTDAPALKADYVHYDVTGLRLTYEDDQLTKLTVLGVASDTGEAEEIATCLDRYEMVQQWIRDEVDKQRPSQALHEAAEKLTIREATPLWDAVNNVLLKYGFYNPANSVPETEKVFELFRAHLHEMADKPNP